MAPLYFYLAALVGLGFVVTGAAMALFGAKSALFPSLGLSRYAYEVPAPYETYPGRERIGPSKTDDRNAERESEAERERQAREARSRAIDERRSRGVDGMLSGLIVAGVGTPVLLWHLKRARALSVAAERPDFPASRAAPTPPPES
ncbi:MAG: hypothetical protein ACRD0Q_08510 [Acidimicrobiales bacterium]